MEVEDATTGKVSDVSIVNLTENMVIIWLRSNGAESLNEASATSEVRWRASARFLRSLIAAIRFKSVQKRFIERINYTYGFPYGEGILLRIRRTEPPREEIDYNWSRRICCLVHRSLEVESLIWHLSTLGGALSAMGDYFLPFADKARVISFKQLELAQCVGDPFLISRAKLYIAISLAQKNQLRAAKKIVKAEYLKAKSMNNVFLLNCCEGIWSKIRTIQMKRFAAKENDENGYVVQSK